MTTPPTLMETARALARRDTSCARVTQACLERIEAREGVVRAWTHLDPASARSAAAAIDRAGGGHALWGVPVGVKDVFDTFDMPTAYGSPIYAGHRPRGDASAVAMLRARGGLVLGKTVSTEFATFPPGPTTNPWHAEHTPGGSSSGSAAAVADGMVPAAFGTQTTGSVIRPAAFCGAVGYKPTFGLLPRVGVKAISECLDTVGCFTRSVADAAFFVGALSGRALAVGDALARPRIGVCLTPQWEHAQPETRALFATLGARLSRAGAEVTDVILPATFDGLDRAQDDIWGYEMARCLADEHARHPDRLRERLRRQLEAGWTIAHDHYDALMARARTGRRDFAHALGKQDVLVVPSSPGEAPHGTHATGDPVFNRMWSLLHTPCVHVPLGFGPRGLPLGVQVVGRIGDDARTLAAAHWVEKHLREDVRLPG